MTDARQHNTRYDQHARISPNGVSQPMIAKGNGSPSCSTNDLHATENGHSAASPDFAGQRIVVLGLARQGMALVRYLCGQGARVTVSDLASEAQLRNEVAALGDLPVSLVLGGHPSSLLEDCDLLFLSGGVPPQIPFVREAIERRIPLSNDSLLTLELAYANGLGPAVAVTGSSGKTTTATLAGLMLTGDDRVVHVGGNIGVPLVDQMDRIRPGEPLVLELSSFQLELFDADLARKPLHRIGPQVAVLTNITPNHLDRHPSMADYVAAKLNLIRSMPPRSRFIVNLDDIVTSVFSSQHVESAGSSLPRDWGLEKILAETRTLIRDRGIEIVPFSLRQELEFGACLVGDKLTLDGEVICDRSEMQLRGEHNVSNMLAAAAVSRAAGAKLRTIRHVATTFQGVPHRLEIVERHDGVLWIDDSIATAPERALAALRSFAASDQTIILLAGGTDKNLPWDAFAEEVIARVKFLIGFGDSGDMIVNFVKEQARFNQQHPPGCATVRRLDEAVALAAKVASPNSIVLLSPGGASFDAYRDFAERGEHFRQLVRQVVNERPASEEPERMDSGDTGRM